MPRRDRKGKHAFWLGQIRLAINALLVKKGVGCINEGETCPARLGRGNMLGVVGWVWLS